MSSKRNSKGLPSVDNQSSDHIAAAARVVIGALPGGSLLSEIIGGILPNQRADRLAQFAQIVEERVSAIDESVMRLKLSNENFTELAEEATRQAARAVTDDRRQYLAAVLANGLTADAVTLVDSRHLLKLLGELNDVEVLWLRFHVKHNVGQDKAFLRKHADVFAQPNLTSSGTEADADKEAMNQGYFTHLTQLGLLAPRYDQDAKGSIVVDPWTGGPKIRSYTITRLGELLLRLIGIFPTRQELDAK